MTAVCGLFWDEGRPRSVPRTGCFGTGCAPSQPLALAGFFGTGGAPSQPLAPGRPDVDDDVESQPRLVSPSCSKMRARRLMSRAKRQRMGAPPRDRV
eukprot:365946-Chlamydomonas_euryale.AAC.12